MGALGGPMGVLWNPGRTNGCPGRTNGCPGRTNGCPVRLTLPIDAVGVELQRSAGQRLQQLLLSPASAVRQRLRARPPQLQPEPGGAQR